MGKYKKSKKKERRPQPTGLPTVQEAENELTLEPPSPASSPLLDKLISCDASEREVACRALSHLMSEPAVREGVTVGRVVRRVGALMLDTDLAVREAAAGALRNWSLIDSEEFFEQMVGEDVMTPLSAMLRGCLAQLGEEGEGGQGSGGVEGEGEGGRGRRRRGETRAVKSSADKERVHRGQVYGVLEQGLHLLWNISERHSLVVEVFNREGLLALLMDLLQPAVHPMPIVLVAARCLHTTTDDNGAAISSLCSSSEHLHRLEALLSSPSSSSSPSPSPSPADGNSGPALLLKTCVAGVFQNVVGGLPESQRGGTVRGVLSVLGGALDTSVGPLLYTLSATPPPSPQQQSGATGDVASPPSKKVSECVRCFQCHVISCDHQELLQAARKESDKADNLVQLIVDTLSAQQVALETLANVCYTEGSEDGEEGEDEDVEEVIGGDDCDTLMETESEDQGDGGASSDLSPAIAAVMELDLHEKVWRLASTVVSMGAVEGCAGWSILAEKLCAVHTASMVALQNLVSALPVTVWGGPGKMAAMWGSLFDHLASSSPSPSAHGCETLVGCLLALMNKLSTSSETVFMTVGQLQLVAQCGLTAEDPSVRADVMVLLGLAGRLALRQQAAGEEILNVVCVCLRDCVAGDSNLWVTAQALDAVFDVFGDDLCPPSLFTSLALLPVLKHMTTTFKARLRVGRKFLGPHLRLVQNTRVNLPRFIDYMSQRAAIST